MLNTGGSGAILELHGKRSGRVIDIGLLFALVMAPVHSAEIDITAPGSVAFGSAVKVLPNGNIVVTDPNGPTANVGTVYLYTPAGIKISSFTGSSPNDHVGSGGIAVLPNGNFVVVSPQWTNGAIANAGAVTWVNGSSGLNGVVSSDNSLVGSSANDQVGYAVSPVQAPYDSVADYSIRVLANGNYVVTSPLWNNGAASQAGAVTFVKGASGIAGTVSAVNSLVGTHVNDQIGSYYCFLLGNGNIVVVSPTWSSALATQVGAVTWMSGTSGLAGVVSPSNSLVGLSANDQVGSSGLTVLTNNNYVILSPTWHNGATASAGAATWADGNAATSGVVSPANSLVGSTSGDQVGFYGTTPLSNGNYVVLSPFWSNGAATSAGAATWANGNGGVSGTVTAANSLVGSTSNDLIGGVGVYALSNGNYVVTSPQWSNGAVSSVGAVTWGSGTTGISGVVSPANSLVGSSSNDQVGGNGPTVLSNGNYVVPSYFWSNGAVGAVGAVTWADGKVGIRGSVTPSNSLVGTTQLDLVGISVYALSNGNYVIDSYDWINAGLSRAGAVTWADGTVGSVGAVSSANSLVGTQANDRIGLGSVTPLANGNYVVGSPNWANAAAAHTGALTWASGTAAIIGVVSATNSLVGSSSGDAIGNAAVALSNGSFVTSSPSWNNAATVASLAGAATWGVGTGPITGVVSPANSLVGTNNNDGIGSDILIGHTRVSGIKQLSDGNYLVFSHNWNNSATIAAGAITLASGQFPLIGNVQAYNSVRGNLANEGATMPEDYDPIRRQLVVGRPLENIVAVFMMDQIFAEGFE